MSDAKDDALETPSGSPLDTDPAETASGREPIDADGFVEPDRHDPAGDEEFTDDEPFDESGGATDRT
jgi:hypothetical protein